MNALIEGKVAQILSESLIVVNVGAARGVTAGMRFAVLTRGEEVTDPDTGKPLGRWEVPKGFVVATHVQDRLSTCEALAPERLADPGDPSTNVLSAALITHSMRPETWRAGSATKLNVNRSQMAGMPSAGPISVGDPVRQVALPPQEPAPPKSEPGKEPPKETARPETSEQADRKADEKPE